MNKLMRCFWLAVLMMAFAVPAHAADEVPGPAQSKPIALVGGTVHTMHGRPIKNGTVVFDKGKIVAVGRNVKIPDGAQRVKVNGKHVYPALFDANTDMGLIEINAVRATRDYSEAGSVNPSAQSHVSVNPDSELIPVARANGVLLALTAPRGGLIAGRSAVIQLDGWTYEDMTLRAGAGMHVDWPRMSPNAPWYPSTSSTSAASARDAALKQLEKLFDDARAYWQARRAADKAKHKRSAVDARFEAMVDVFERRVPLIVSADDLAEIQAAVAFANRQNVRLIIYGGYDAPHCAALLKEHGVSVIVAGTHRLPRRRDEGYDTAFTVPQRLRAADVTYCINGRFRFGAAMVRNLPYHAASAAAFGLPRDEAIKAITLYPAQVLGVADRVGSLKVGKDATLIVTDGDPLEITTHVKAAYVQGRAVQLTSRHTRLNEKYQKKYERTGSEGE